jgi:hypothetical protein
MKTRSQSTCSIHSLYNRKKARDESAKQVKAASFPEVQDLLGLCIDGCLVRHFSPHQRVYYFKGDAELGPDYPLNSKREAEVVRAACARIKNWFQASCCQTITSMEFIVDEEKDTLYQESKQNKDTDDIFLFHGTPQRNISKILKEGFQSCHFSPRSTLGKGVYLSSKAHISLDYTDVNYYKGLEVSLLVCKTHLEDFKSSHESIYMVPDPLHVLPVCKITSVAKDLATVCLAI